MSRTEIEVAQACARLMWANDRASKEMGLELGEVTPGEASVHLTVRPDMLNGHGVCHGGVIFAMADTAFAFACNSLNRRAIAMHCSISFIEKVDAGARLTAHASGVAVYGRNGIFDVTVTDDQGVKIAEFRGYSRTIGGEWVSEG
ncbi:MAG: hydroxyphenylacetyl-CoA thioesterase PaaI [Gammaproteobacteria bacterium]|nr:hydroxyphenylacetyl-CoA thioesterase PaaI [Gammaproteobacteria bacterium]